MANYRGNQVKSKNFKTLQLILRILVIITCAFAIFMASYVFMGKPMPGILNEIGPGLAIMLVGIIATLLPVLNKMDVNSGDRGDTMMKIIGLILIVIGIGTIIFSCIS